MQMNLIKMLSRSSSLEKSKICYILQGGRDLENEVALPLGEAEARFVFTKTSLRQGEHCLLYTSDAADELMRV